MENLRTDCVHCGACCMKAPCPFGEPVSEEGNSCRFLVEVGEQDAEIGYKLFFCGRYKEIADEPTSELCPAFGAGCCQTLFNTRREHVIRCVLQSSSIKT